MKKLGITLLGIFFTLLVSANHLSSLIVELEEHTSFIVWVDNNQFYSHTNITEIKDIQQGSHFIKIMTKKGSCDTYNKVLYQNTVYFDASSTVKAKVNYYNEVDLIKHVSTDCDHSVQYHCGGGKGMHCESFKNLLWQIETETFDSSRLKIAKQALRANKITSKQVSLLLEKLTFESNKLELAKFAYRRTVDTYNYFLVADKLTFDSSKDQLFDYIEGEY